METSEQRPGNIDEYIARFPPDIQEILEKIRATVRAAAPGAGEAMSYQIPTFQLHGNLVHFAAFKNHIGFYPTSSGMEKFKEELAEYPSAKGSVQFPLDRPIPYDLIAQITAFRVAENLEKAAKKRKPK